MISANDDLDFKNFYNRKPLSDDVISFVRGHYFLDPLQFAQFLHEEIEDEQVWYCELVQYYKIAVKKDARKKRLWCEWVELCDFTSMWFNFMNYENFMMKQ